MNVFVNGKSIELSKQMPISKMLDELGYRDKFVAVAINQNCISRSQYDSTIINEHDEIEVLAPMAGG